MDFVDARRKTPTETLLSGFYGVSFAGLFVDASKLLWPPSAETFGSMVVCLPPSIDESIGQKNVRYDCLVLSRALVQMLYAVFGRVWVSIDMLEYLRDSIRRLQQRDGFQDDILERMGIGKVFGRLDA